MSRPTMAKPSATALGLAFATIYLGWGSTYLSMKVAAQTMPPFAMASARFLLVGAILGMVSHLRGMPRATTRQWRDNLVVGVLLLLGGNGLIAWAGQFVPSGTTALLLAMTPFCMVLAGWIWPGGKRPTALEMGGLALGLVGAVMLAAPWESSPQAGVRAGALAAIVAACFSWAIGSIASRDLKDKAPLLAGSAMQMIGGGVALAIVAIATGELRGFDVGTVSRESWLAWGYLLFIGLLGFPVYTWLLEHSTPARVSTYAYVNPVVAVFLGWLVLDEPIGVRTLVCAAVIVVAVVLIKLPESGRGWMARRVKAPRVTHSGIRPIGPPPVCTAGATGQSGDWPRKIQVRSVLGEYDPERATELRFAR